MGFLSSWRIAGGLSTLEWLFSTTPPLHEHDRRPLQDNLHLHSFPSIHACDTLPREGGSYPTVVESPLTLSAHYLTSITPPKPKTPENLPTYVAASQAASRETPEEEIHQCPGRHGSNGTHLPHARAAHRRRRSNRGPQARRVSERPNADVV